MRSTLFDSSEAEKLGFHAVRSPLDRLANGFLVVVDAQTQFNISKETPSSRLGGGGACYHLAGLHSDPIRNDRNDDDDLLATVVGDLRLSRRSRRVDPKFNDCERNRRLQHDT